MGEIRLAGVAAPSTLRRSHCHRVRVRDLPVKGEDLILLGNASVQLDLTAARSNIRRIYAYPGYICMNQKTILRSPKETNKLDRQYYYHSYT